MLGVHLFNFFPKPTNIATNTCKFTVWFGDIIYSNLILIFEPIVPSTDYAVNLHVKKKILKLLSKFKFSHPFSGIIKKKRPDTISARNRYCVFPRKTGRILSEISR